MAKENELMKLELEKLKEEVETKIRKGYKRIPYVNAQLLLKLLKNSEGKD